MKDSVCAKTVYSVDDVFVLLNVGTVHGDVSEYRIFTGYTTDYRRGIDVTPAIAEISMSSLC